MAGAKACAKKVNMRLETSIYTMSHGSSLLTKNSCKLFANTHTAHTYTHMLKVKSFGKWWLWKKPLKKTNKKTSSKSPSTIRLPLFLHLLLLQYHPVQMQSLPPSLHLHFCLHYWCRHLVMVLGRKALYGKWRNRDPEPFLESCKGNLASVEGDHCQIDTISTVVAEQTRYSDIIAR